MTFDHNFAMKVCQSGFRYPTDKIFSDPALKHESISFLPEFFEGKKTYILTDRIELRMFEKKLGPLITTLDGFTDEEISKSVFYVFFNFDNDSLPFIKKIKNCGGIFIPPVLTGKVDYMVTDKWACYSIIETEQYKDRISHFNYNIYNNIAEAINITKNLEGDYCEIGVYLGGSALFAGTYIQKLKETNQIKNRKMYLLDTFDGFTYDDATKSSDQIWKNTHRLDGVEKTMQKVSENIKLCQTPFELIQSNICEDVLPEGMNKITVANIDVDMYEPTLDALNKVSDLIVSGGIIICEDPTSTPGLYGAYMAMEEFLESEKGKQYVKFFKGAQYFLYKDKNQ